MEFGSLLQQIAADFYASPGSSKLRGILAEIDDGYKERLSQRTAKLEEAAAKAVADKQRSQSRGAKMSEMRPSQPSKESNAAAKEAKEHAKPSKPTGEKHADKSHHDDAGKKAKDKPSPPPAPKKKVEPQRLEKKSPAKGFVKKKPR